MLLAAIELLSLVALVVGAALILGPGAAFLAGGACGLWVCRTQARRSTGASA